MKTELLTKPNNLPVTTGVCAAAAAKAAAYNLYSGEPLKEVEVQLPNAERVKLKVYKKTNPSPSSSSYFAIKPNNDDPDITKNIKIYATATRGTKLDIKAGVGIGKITKPGLAQKVGQAAINPVPLKMIKDEVKQVLPKDKGATITISAPQGKELAVKTFNKRLGIVGGISILGTTGLVKPMSIDAYKTSLSAQIDIALAAGFKEIAITPGNIGQKAAKELGFSEESTIICSNFIGYAINQCKDKDLKKITLIGHLGKLLKILDGHFNTHNKKAPLNLKLLSPFLTADRISKLNSAEEAISILTKDDLNKIAGLINEKTNQYINRSTLNLPAGRHGGQLSTASTYLINLRSQIVGASDE